MSDCILVTGGAGFIGSHVVDRLLAQGHHAIILDDLSTGKAENVNPSAVFYQGDISDPESVRSAFDNHKINYVIHAAAKINLSVESEDPPTDIRTSVLGTLNLLRCCAEYGVNKLIYASSVAVYGRPSRMPVAETDPLVPIYSYGIAKKCAEDYVRFFGENHGLNYTILRYANVYGPRQPIFGEVGVIAIYTERVAKGQMLTIYGDGEQLRDYVYIDDVVSVTLAALTNGDRGTFNVGCGVGISVNQLYAQFCELAGHELPCEHKPEREGEIGDFYCDTDNLTQVKLIHPAVQIPEGIHRTLSFYGLVPRLIPGISPGLVP